ncbi:MAG: 30S ribosomal protein S11 [Candidatus Paceibacterota bacterium]
MGKKRIVKKAGGENEGKKKTGKRPVKKRLDTGVLYVHSTYNNTKVAFADTKGNVVAWSSSGSLGFKGAKKGTPFAAAKVGEVVGDQVYQMGAREVKVSVKGVGAGRESSIRGFTSKGISISEIEDVTPVPHNGPRPPKPRRV